jgi:hypothetical protein
MISEDLEVAPGYALAREAKQSYEMAFSSPPARVVLTDLLLFCNALTATFAFDGAGRADPYLSAFNEGKRAVWNRIASRLGLTTEELYRLCRDDRNQLRG